jgi:hypothetical protein
MFHKNYITKNRESILKFLLLFNILKSVWMSSGCLVQLRDWTVESSADGRGCAPLERGSGQPAAHRPVDAASSSSPRGSAQKHFHTASPTRDGGVKVLLSYFLTRK